MHFMLSAKKARITARAMYPTVTISTKQRWLARIEIRVKDNGMVFLNHQRKNISTIFHHQTTGQGTGLGLSLSYDIVKAHGGTLEVNSPPAGRAGKEGCGIGIYYSTTDLTQINYMKYIVLIVLLAFQISGSHAQFRSSDQVFQ